MYNKQVLDHLIKLIESNNGIADKSKLADIVQKEFSLTQDRKVYYSDDFASLKSWKLESAKKVTTYIDPKLIIDGSEMWETLFASVI